MHTQASEPDVLSLPETARLLRVSEDTVRRWINVSKVLPATRIGGRPNGAFRIRRRDAESMLVRE